MSGTRFDRGGGGVSVGRAFGGRPRARTKDARSVVPGYSPSAERQSRRQARRSRLHSERLDEKRGHLRPGVGVAGAIFTPPPAARDLFGCELFDPVGKEARASNVEEEAAARWRHVRRSVLGPEKECSHLRPRPRVGWTVVAIA